MLIAPLKYMKLFFSLVFFILLSQPLFSNEIKVKYKIKTKGISIGSLTWILKNEKGFYKTSIELQSEGIISSLYNFEGKYVAEGATRGNSLYSSKYYQFWKTKKKKRLFT